MVTLLVLGGQTPLVIVQRKTYTPGVIPVTVDVGEPGVVIVAPPGPLNCVQIPDQTTGVLPASVIPVAAHRV